MTKLNLKLFDVEGAWDSRDSQETEDILGISMQSFLNIKTGEVIFASSEEMDEEEFEALMEQRNPDLLPFPDPWSWPKVDGFQTMEGFIDEVESPTIQNDLRKALQGGRGVFRRFKDVVHSDVETRNLWRWYETCRERESMEEWLSSHDIEPTWDKNLYQRPDHPNKRPALCEAVLEFVNKASKLDGVESISLLGSLTTDKRTPKDVDLLVVIRDSVSIQTLAKYKRSLLGKTMATGDSCGADVFVCDTQHKYLGRMCSYRECHPRRACDAQQCGSYICNDFQSVTLETPLLKSPPIQLWPEVIERVDVPDDVRQLVVEALKKH